MKRRTVYPIFILVMSIAILAVAPHSYALTSTEVETELMCNCGCGDILANCVCEESDELRAIIGGMIDDGNSKKEIVDAFVQRFGQVILSAPPPSGFNIIAYIMPFVGLLLGTGVAFLFVTKWTARNRSEELSAVSADGSDAGLDEETARRIREELEDLGEDY